MNDPFRVANIIIAFDTQGCALGWLKRPFRPQQSARALQQATRRRRMSLKGSFCQLIEATFQVEALLVWSPYGASKPRPLSLKGSLCQPRPKAWVSMHCDGCRA